VLGLQIFADEKGDDGDLGDNGGGGRNAARFGRKRWQVFLTQIYLWHVFETRTNWLTSAIWGEIIVEKIIIDFKVFISIFKCAITFSIFPTPFFCGV